MTRLCKKVFCCITAGLIFHVSYLWADEVEGQPTSKSPGITHADQSHRPNQDLDLLLLRMQVVMGKFQLPKSKVTYSVQSAQNFQSYTLQKINYPGFDDKLVPAYLFLQKNCNPRCPSVIALHQTTDIGKAEPAGLGGNPNLHYAKELAENGYNVIAPDYPSFGENQFDFLKYPEVSGTMVGIVNHIRAIDVLTGLPESDPQRIGVIGHSLGGHNAIFLAAFDPRVKVVVSSCGWTPFDYYLGGNLENWAQPRYMPRIKSQFGSSSKKMPFDFVDVISSFSAVGFFSNSPKGDYNFDYTGVQYAELLIRKNNFGDLSDRLEIIYPEYGHDFPKEVRERAYGFMDRFLKGNK